jgi:hypothetical protein
MYLDVFILLNVYLSNTNKYLHIQMIVSNVLHILWNTYFQRKHRFLEM